MPEDQEKNSITIDTDACISCGSCADMAPEIFTLNEQMKSTVRKGMVIDREKLLKAVQNCPVGAISIANMENAKKSD